MDGQLTLLVVAALPVSGTVIAVALVVLALVVAIGGFLVYRSGGKKGAKAATGTANADWQRQTQGQQNGAGNWNPQGAGNDAPAWSQQNQGQPNNSWGGQGQPNQQQQQAQQPAWNAQPPMQQQQAASPWGAPAGMPQQQQTGPWGGGQGNAQGQSGNQWGGGTQPAANQWDAQGNQMNAGGGRAPWEAEPAPVAQEPWNQPPPASPQQQWGGQANMQQPQQAPNAFGGGGGMSSGPAWNQPNFAGGPNGQNGQNAQAGMNGQADAWLAPQAQNAPNNAAGGFAGALGTVPQPQAWQQPSAPQQQFGGGVQQQQQTPPFAGADGGFLANDGDKTMMRPSGGLGLVRVEEGKEPGREYKIVKESLSIGRSRESDIFLEDLAVSRLHASVVNQGNGQYALKDEGSANGTKVNGQLVGKFQVFPLQEGDRIQLGQTVLVFARN